MPWPLTVGHTDTSGTGQVAQNVLGFYDRNLLNNTQPQLIWHLFGQVKTLPQGEGTRITFRRYAELATNTTQLTQGVTPAGKQMSATDIYAEIGFYGDYVILTDVLLLTVPDKNITNATKTLGRQAGKSMDLVWRAVLVAGTSVAYTNGAAATDVNTIISEPDINLAEQTLDGNDRDKIAEAISATPNVNTEAVDPGYYAICHSDLKRDLFNLPNFTQRKDYPSQKGVLKQEIGALGEVRFLTTSHGYKVAGGGAAGGTNVKETGGVADVYHIVIFSADAYGIIPLGKAGKNKSNIQTIVKQLGSAGADDPLNQRASVGWKSATAAKIIDDDGMYRIVCACTDLTAI